MIRRQPRATSARRRSRVLLALALGAALCAPAIRSQTEARADPPASPPAASNEAVDPKDEIQTPESAGEDDESSKFLGWLVLSTDAPATVVVAGTPVGTLQPEDTMRHGIETTSAEVVATSLDVPGAIWRETVSLAPKTAQGDGDEDEGEGDDAPEHADAVEARETGADPETTEPGKAEVGLRTSVKVRIRMLAAIEDVRKIERRDKVWPHYETGLMWPKEDNKADVTWSKAGRHCAELRLGGWDDWRLPRIDELATLQAMWSQAAFKTISPVIVSACCPWSSSELDDDRAWNYNFRFRRQFEGQKGFSYDLRALCVRTLTAEEISAHEQELADAKRKKKEAKKARKSEADTDESGPGDPITDDGNH